jgi:hypothetical protein
MCANEVVRHGEREKENQTKNSKADVQAKSDEKSLAVTPQCM